MYDKVSYFLFSLQLISLQDSFFVHWQQCSGRFVAFADDTTAPWHCICGSPPPPLKDLSLCLLLYLPIYIRTYTYPHQSGTSPTHSHCMFPNVSFPCLHTSHIAQLLTCSCSLHLTVPSCSDAILYVHCCVDTSASACLCTCACRDVCALFCTVDAQHAHITLLCRSNYWPYFCIGCEKVLRSYAQALQSFHWFVHSTHSHVQTPDCWYGQGQWRTMPNPHICLGTWICARASSFKPHLQLHLLPMATRIRPSAYPHVYW